MDALYQAELARAKERHDARSAARRLDGRARRILQAAGWDAMEGELEAAAVADELIPEDERGVVICRAIEMQGDERYTGRRIDPTQEAEVGTITKDRRDQIVKDAADALRAAPNLTGNEIRKRMNAQHRVLISEANWYNTYAPKVRQLLAADAPSTNGRRRTRAAQAAARPLIGPDLAASIIGRAGVALSRDPGLTTHALISIVAEAFGVTIDEDTWTSTYLPKVQDWVAAATPEPEPERDIEAELDATEREATEAVPGELLETDEVWPLISVTRSGPGRFRVYIDHETDLIGAVLIAHAAAGAIARQAGAFR